MIPRERSGRYPTINKLHEKNERFFRPGHRIDVPDEKACGPCPELRPCHWQGLVRFLSGRDAGFYDPGETSLSAAMPGLSSGGCRWRAGDEPEPDQVQVCIRRQGGAGQDRAEWIERGGDRWGQLQWGDGAACRSYRPADCGCTYLYSQ